MFDCAVLRSIMLGCTSRTMLFCVLCVYYGFILSFLLVKPRSQSNRMVHQPREPATVLVFEKAPEVLARLVADALDGGNIQHCTKDAVNAHLIMQYGFPAAVKQRNLYKAIWHDLAQALNIPNLCSAKMNSLSKMTVSRRRLTNSF